MLRVEQQFETLIFDSGAQEPPVRHYVLAQIVFEVPVWHVRLLRPASQPEDIRRWEHYVVTKARLAAGILVSNSWLDAEVKVLLPGYMSSTGQLELVVCKSLWDGHANGEPDRRVCLFETDKGIYVDPPDGVQSSDVTRKSCYWQVQPIAA